MNQDTQNTIRGIIEKIPIETEEVSFSVSDDNQAIWCQVKTKEPHFFTNRDGEALGALNHIIRKIVEKSFFDKNPTQSPLARQGPARPTGGLGVGGASIPIPSPKIIIDINGFQKKKIENLKTLAHMLSERAKFFKSSIETDPLPAFERKTIHEFLADKPNIKTESTGLEPYRRVVIKYTE